MRSFTGGDGSDTTAAVLAWLAAHRALIPADLYLIGDLDDPQALALTSWESPLCWPIWGTKDPVTGLLRFLPAVVERGDIESKIGLAVSDLELTWTPLNTAYSESIETASPYQLAQLGFFDNKLFRCWTTLMPTPGDASTFGAAAMFGGRVGQSKTDRGKIVFTVNSFLDVVNEMVPTNVIELTNALAGYAGATPPAGMDAIPQFAVVAGSGGSPLTAGTIIGDETGPNAHQLFARDALRGGFLNFNAGAGATLARQLARIASNDVVVIGLNHYNRFILYDPLPWAPTVGVDTFFVSGAAPVNTGAITSAEIDNPGTGFTVGDRLSVSDGHAGTAAVIEVMAVGGGGAIAAVQVVDGGQGYIPTTGAAASGGTGAGATFDIGVVPEGQGFPYVPAPQTGV
jgi:hypothetical protein